MNLIYLRYFLKVAELENVTAAAAELFISQPSLSKALQKFSQDLGYPLFYSQNKKLSLTENGKILKEYGQDILQCLDNIPRKLALQDQEQPEFVHIDTRVALNFMDMANLAFSQKYPQVKYIIYNHQQIPPQKRHYDIVIRSSLSSCEENQTVSLLKEEIRLAVPQTHYLARRKKVFLKDLMDEPIIRLTEYYLFWQHLEQWFLKEKFQPHYSLEIDNYMSCYSLVEAGIGCAFVPAKTWGDWSAYQICLLPIQANTVLNRYITLTWTDQKLSEPVKLYRDFIMDFFKNSKFA